MLIFFAFLYSSWGSHNKNIGVVCHSLLHVLSDLCTMNSPSSVAHSFIELHKPLHYKAVIHEGGFKQLTHWKIPDSGKD